MPGGGPGAVCSLTEPEQDLGLVLPELLTRSLRRSCLLQSVRSFWPVAKLTLFPPNQGTALCHAGAQLAGSSPEFSQNPELRLQVCIRSRVRLFDK